MKTENIIELILKKLDEKKAQDIKAFDVKKLTSLCDYIIITSTSNSTHVKSLTDEVIKMLKENDKDIQNIEKDTNYTWVIIDCNDFIINIFHNKEREFYNLEELWADAKEIFTN